MLLRDEITSFLSVWHFSTTEMIKFLECDLDDSDYFLCQEQGLGGCSYDSPQKAEVALAGVLSG